MRITTNPHDLMRKAKNKLIDITIDEIALVRKGSIPVHPGALITMVKAQKNQDSGITENDIRTFQRVLAALKLEKSEDLEENEDEEEETEEEETEVEKSTAKPTKTPSKKTSKKNDDNPEDNGDDIEEANTSSTNKKGKKTSGKMGKSEDVEELLGLTTSIDSLTSKIEELNKAFIAHVQEETEPVEKSEKTEEAEVETKEEKTEVAPATNGFDLSAIEALFAKAFAPIAERLQGVESRLDEVSNVAKAAQDSVAQVSEDTTAQVVQMLNKASAQVLDQARTNDIPNMTDQAGSTNPAMASLRNQNKNLTMDEMISRLMHPSVE